MVYLVTYDLNKKKPNYAQLRLNFIVALGKFESIKDPGLDSVWFISSLSSADEISEYLKEFIDSDDRLVVTRLTRNEYRGWLRNSVWDWIYQHLD